jgi:hypothetical protein
MSAKAVPLDPNPATTGQLLVFDIDDVARIPAALLGWSIAESTGGSGASFEIHDGQNAEAPSLSGVVTLTSNESNREWFGDQTIEIFSGSVYFNVISGSVEGVVFLSQ